MTNIKIGDKFLGRGKNECEVVDIHTVTDSKGNIVRTENIAESKCLGQTIRFVVPSSTVKLNKIN